VLAACYLHVFFNDYSLVNKGPAVGNSIGWDLERARWSEQTGVAPRKDQFRPFFIKVGTGVVFLFQGVDTLEDHPVIQCRTEHCVGIWSPSHWCSFSLRDSQD